MDGLLKAFHTAKKVKTYRFEIAFGYFNKIFIYHLSQFLHLVVIQ
jgi:hypothetical protein